MCTELSVRSVVDAHSPQTVEPSFKLPYEVQELPKYSLTTYGTMTFQELSNLASVSDEMYYLDNVFKMWEEKDNSACIELRQDELWAIPRGCRSLA